MDYEASFDQSYSYYGVLIDILTKIAPYLTEGSYIDISGDESSCNLTVHKACMIFTDTTSDDDDDK